MAAYRRVFMTHVTCRLTAENRDQPRKPTLTNRAWSSFVTGTLVGATSDGCFPGGENVRRGEMSGHRRRNKAVIRYLSMSGSATSPKCRSQDDETPRSVHPGDLYIIYRHSCGVRVACWCNRERKCADTIGTVLVPCMGWPFPVLKYKYFFSNKIYGSNFIERHSETAMV